MQNKVLLLRSDLTGQCQWTLTAYLLDSSEDVKKALEQTIKDYSKDIEEAGFATITIQEKIVPFLHAITEASTAS